MPTPFQNVTVGGNYIECRKVPLASNFPGKIHPMLSEVLHFQLCFPHASRKADYQGVLHRGDKGRRCPALRCYLKEINYKQNVMLVILCKELCGVKNACPKPEIIHNLDLPQQQICIKLLFLSVDISWSFMG